MTYFGIDFQSFDNELRQSSAVGTRSTWSFVCKRPRKFDLEAGFFYAVNKSAATTKAAFSALGKAKSELVSLNE